MCENLRSYSGTRGAAPLIRAMAVVSSPQESFVILMHMKLYIEVVRVRLIFKLAEHDGEAAPELLWSCNTSILSKRRTRFKSWWRCLVFAVLFGKPYYLRSESSQWFSVLLPG